LDEKKAMKNRTEKKRQYGRECSLGEMILGVKEKGRQRRKKKRGKSQRFYIRKGKRGGL